MIGNLIFATLFAVTQRMKSVMGLNSCPLSLRRLVVPGVFQIEIGDNELDKIIFLLHNVVVNVHLSCLEYIKSSEDVN